LYLMDQIIQVESIFIKYKQAIILKQRNYR